MSEIKFDSLSARKLKDGSVSAQVFFPVGTTIRDLLDFMENGGAITNNPASENTVDCPRCREVSAHIERIARLFKEPVEAVEQLHDAGLPDGLRFPFPDATATNEKDGD